MKHIFLWPLLLLSGCSTSPPNTLGEVEGKLAPCPNSPNCVSSMARDDSHAIAPLKASIEEIAQIAKTTKRTNIVSHTGNYLHIEYRSKIMRFIDDVEFLYIPLDDTTHVRSASRLGKSDLGVNRKRIEKLRAQLERQQTMP